MAQIALIILTAMRKKSKYKPRPAGLPINFRFGRESELRLQLEPHAELDNFRRGTATEESWHTLAARVHLGHELALRHYTAEALIPFAAAMSALKDVWLRFQRVQKWGVNGEEFKAIGDALNICDEMQKQCTRRQLDEALRSTLKYALTEL